MPMNTTLNGWPANVRSRPQRGRPGRRSRPRHRCRTRPILPVRQKSQPSAQPTWLDTHSVTPRATAPSTPPRPSRRPRHSMRYLTVPSLRLGAPGDPSRVDPDALRQAIAQRPRKIGPGPWLEHRPRVQPAVDLARAEPGRIVRRERGRELVKVEAEQVRGAREVDRRASVHDSAQSTTRPGRPLTVARTVRYSPRPERRPR